jgi:hypothetical protein
MAVRGRRSAASLPKGRRFTNRRPETEGGLEKRLSFEATFRTRFNHRTIFAVKRRSGAGWIRTASRRIEATRGDNTANRASRLIQSRPR